MPGCHFCDAPLRQPQLRRRGLDRSADGAVATHEDERALLWVPNQSDGHSTLLDSARHSGLRYPVVRQAARLDASGLLATNCLSAAPNP